MVESCPGDGGGVELGLKLSSISHHCLGKGPSAARGSLLRFAGGALGSGWVGMESRESEKGIDHIC